MTMNYHIRAEYEDLSYEDFQTQAEDRVAAQMRAERRLMDKKDLPAGTKFRWVGMVVFITKPDPAPASIDPRGTYWSNVP